MRHALALKCAALAALCAVAGGASAEAPPRRLPPLATASPVQGAPRALRKAVFAGGCFWGVQAVFSHVRGVVEAASGYAGGGAVTARYPLVATGLTGHAESVEVTYDPSQVSYADLLRVFFSVALDLTEVGRQGPDEGSQYRSVVWTQGLEQQREAQAYIRQLDAAHAFQAAIATRAQPLPAFYKAEAEHQDFYARHPGSPYIQAWDVQKVEALRSLFPALYTARPSLALTTAAEPGPAHTRRS